MQRTAIECPAYLIQRVPSPFTQWAAPHCILHSTHLHSTLHCALSTLHCALHTSHITLRITLYIALYTRHITEYCLLCTLHSKEHLSGTHHFTRHITKYCTLYTSQCRLDLNDTALHELLMLGGLHSIVVQCSF